MNDNNFKKYIIEQTKNVYKNVPLNSVSINNYVGPEVGNVSALLPGFSML